MTNDSDDTKEMDKFVPKWSLTKQQNDNQMDMEVDSLLGFIDDLSMDEFLQDLEIKQHLQSINNRVKKIKQEKEKENTSDNDQENESKTNTPTNTTTIDADIETTDEIDTIKKSPVILQPKLSTAIIEKKDELIFKPKSTYKLATEILKKCRDFRQIHSQQSILSVINKIKKKDNKDRLSDTSSVVTDIEVHNLPRMSYIRDKVRPLKKRNMKQHDVNNLPYLYRSRLV